MQRVTGHPYSAASSQHPREEAPLHWPCPWPCLSLSPVTQDHDLTIFCFILALPTACITQIPVHDLGFPPGYMRPPIQEHSRLVHVPLTPALGPSSHPLRVCRADALELVLTLQLLLLKSLPFGSREQPRCCSFDFLFHYGL